jgi:hypothetical protein
VTRFQPGSLGGLAHQYCLVQDESNQAEFWAQSSIFVIEVIDPTTGEELPDALVTIRPPETREEVAKASGVLLRPSLTDIDATLKASVAGTMGGAPTDCRLVGCDGDMARFTAAEARREKQELKQAVRVSIACILRACGCLACFFCSRLNVNSHCLALLKLPPFFLPTPNLLYAPPPPTTAPLHEPPLSSCVWPERFVLYRFIFFFFNSLRLRRGLWSWAPGGS